VFAQCAQRGVCRPQSSCLSTLLHCHFFIFFRIKLIIVFISFSMFKQALGYFSGHYIRERSKQVITLLMDEQLLHKEREVATWTRQRTSYSMSFPSRLSATGTSPTVCTSVLIPESLTSEKKHSQDCKKTAGLCSKSTYCKQRPNT
jgi:hypothetical protein